MSSGKWWPFCLSLNMLKESWCHHIDIIYINPKTENSWNYKRLKFNKLFRSQGIRLSFLVTFFKICFKIHFLQYYSTLFMIICLENVFIIKVKIAIWRWQTYLDQKSPQFRIVKGENCTYKTQDSCGGIHLVKLKKNTRSGWLPCHVMGKDQDQVMAICHVYIEHDVLSHELKYSTKIQILKLVLIKPETYVN